MMLLWVKAWHIIFVVTWFAGLFYLPRLFVYHTLATDPIGIDRFKIMERRLFVGIMTPSALLATALGIWLICLNPQYYLKAGWMHLKLLFVCFLVGYHLLCGRYVKQFKRDNNSHSTVFYRWFNEVPLIILAVVVICVVVKPL